MTGPEINGLSRQVQHNCHISDARHGGDYAMCTYLMKMREYFRWEQNLPFGARLDRDAVGGWLAEREQLWESLEDRDYAPLEVAGERFGPFDAASVNRCLEPHGLVYSAGVGQHGKPHFFLARLERTQTAGGGRVLVAGREYARDLGAPPAMTQDRTIYVRRESLRRMLWEQLESWRWNRPDNALGRAFACYDFEDDLHGSLDAMTELETEAVLLHEQGEDQAGQRLGEAWNTLVWSLMGTPAELMARAVRDHLADCLVTLPALAGGGQAASIHFYLGNLTPMRQEIFPALGTAYRQWLGDGATAPLLALARRGAGHWERLARALLRQAGEPAETRPAAVVAQVRGAWL
jgi:hypothetical protein